MPNHLWESAVRVMQKQALRSWWPVESGEHYTFISFMNGIIRMCYIWGKCHFFCVPFYSSIMCSEGKEHPQLCFGGGTGTSSGQRNLCLVQCPQAVLFVLKACVGQGEVLNQWSVWFRIVLYRARELLPDSLIMIWPLCWVFVVV